MSVVFFAHSLGCVLFYFGVIKVSKAFGEHLRNLRKTRTEYNQQQMAELLNIGMSRYTCYETGETEPNYQNLKKLSEIFEIEFNELLGYEE